VVRVRLLRRVLPAVVFDNMLLRREVWVVRITVLGEIITLFGLARPTFDMRLPLRAVAGTEVVELVAITLSRRVRDVEAVEFPVRLVLLRTIVMTGWGGVA